MIEIRKKKKKGQNLCGPNTGTLKRKCKKFQQFAGKKSYRNRL